MILKSGFVDDNKYLSDGKKKKVMINRVKQLETLLREAENKISALFREGKIPSSTDYGDVDRIKKELKVARRVVAMEANRKQPKKTSRFSVLLPDDELDALNKKAKERGMVFSKYIRHLLKIALKVEEETRIKGKSGD